MRKIAQ